MKQKFLSISIAVLISVCTQHNAFSQFLVPPALIDNSWVPGPGVTGINTALIDIPDYGTDDRNHPWRQLAACAYDGGIAGGVVVTDMRCGFQVNTPFPAGGYSGNPMVSVPDVIWGNKAGSNTDFILAVAFANSASLIEVDYFDVSYTSWVTFTVTFNSFQTFPPGFLYVPLGTVHLDVVARSSTPGPYGLPFCDGFFVTWDGKSAFGIPNRVFSSYGSLNAYNALITGPACLNCGCLYAQDAMQPDVAGVERGPFGGPYRDVASFTWVSGGGLWPSGNVLLYYSEWDPSLGIGCASLSSYVQLDGTILGPPSPFFTNPRIDANDDFATNGGIWCQSKVVAETFNNFPLGSGNTDVGIYSPMMPGGLTSSAWVNISGLPGGPFPAPAYLNYAPHVAYGPNWGTEFMVTQCSNTGVGDFFTMSPIGLPCGSGVAPSPAGPPLYFEINSVYPATSSNYANAVSTPCNNVADTSLVAWTHANIIWYKRSGFDPTPSPGYSYKNSQQPARGLQQGKISIYPNPAGDRVTINNPAKDGADNCEIRNMLGQSVNRFPLSSGEQEINISSLAAGQYIIRFYQNGACIGNDLFVKE